MTVFVHEKVVTPEYAKWLHKLPMFGITEVNQVNLYRKPTSPGEEEERLVCRELEIDLDEITRLKEKVPAWARKLVGLG